MSGCGKKNCTNADRLLPVLPDEAIIRIMKHMVKGLRETGLPSAAAVMAEAADRLEKQQPN